MDLSLEVLMKVREGTISVPGWHAQLKRDYCVTTRTCVSPDIFPVLALIPKISIIIVLL